MLILWMPLEVSRNLIGHPLEPRGTPVLCHSFILSIWILQNEFFNEMRNASNTFLLVEIDLKSLKLVGFVSYLMISFGSFR